MSYLKLVFHVSCIHWYLPLHGSFMNESILNYKCKCLTSPIQSSDGLFKATFRRWSGDPLTLGYLTIWRINSEIRGLGRYFILCQDGEELSFKTHKQLNQNILPVGFTILQPVDIYYCHWPWNNANDVV